MTGLAPEDLQPTGNAAAAEQVAPEEFGDSWWHYIPVAGQLGYGIERGVDALSEAWDDYQAQSWWTEYKAAAEARRQEMAHDAWMDGSLQQKIDALEVAQQVDPASFRNELGEVLDYLQQFEMMREAGMTWEQLAAAQGTFMVDEARRRAAASSSTGAPPTDAELRQAHEESVGEQTYLGAEDTSWWDGLTPAEQAAWNARGVAAVTRWVAFAATAHPELAVRESEIGVDIPGNSNSVAYVDGAGKCWIGKSTIEAIERDPAYATSTILHELRGHPEFDTGFSLSMELYDAAAPAMPGYSRPADGTDARNDEWTRFEYFESEIGALMREESFWVASRDLDGDGAIAEAEQNPLGAPDALLDDLLTNLAGQFAPTVQGPFVIGLARRFRADPRITETANQMFASACQRKLGITV